MHDRSDPRRAVAAGSVLDDKGLAEIFADMVEHDVGHQIVRGPGDKGAHHLD